MNYTSKKRIIHLDENYCWKLEKKKPKSIINTKTQFFPLFTVIEHVLLQHKNAKRKKVNYGQTIIEKSHEFFSLAFPLYDFFRLVHEYFFGGSWRA